MLIRELRRFLDILHGENFAREIRLDDVLQSRHFGVIEKTAARTDIRIYMSRICRVLPPVRELVAVRIQNRIESQRLNGSSPWRKRRWWNDLRAMRLLCLLPWIA